MITTVNAPCHACHYPIQEPAYDRQQIKCPYCGAINEAITQVTIPTPVFVGFIAFVAGVLFGPALLAATDVGQRYLEERIRRGK